VLSNVLLGQKKSKTTGLDSVHVKGKTYLVIGDTSIYIRKDTIFYLPDSIASKMKKDRQRNSSAVYENIKEKLSKRKVTKEIYKILFNDLSKNKNPSTSVALPTDEFSKYEGRVISEIIIKKLEPFGTRITDTSRHTDDWRLKAANGLHIKTRAIVIKNNLFFKEGDNVDPNLLRDTERILRTLPYIKDARVYIIPKEGTFQVDVLVITREIWSISGGFRYSDIDQFDVEISDKNFLGLGHELRNEFPYSGTNVPQIGYLGTYIINNIRKSFVTGELTYARSQPLDRKGIKFYRNFITPDIKYAGGLEIAQERLEQSRVYIDTTLFFFTKYSFLDIWFGRSWLISNDPSGHTNFQIAVKFSKRDYLDRPMVRGDTNQIFYNNSLKLISFGLTKRRFERSSLIAGFGRTEDIPIGHLAEFTIGRDNNEFYNRTYIGSKVSYGDYVGRKGYFRPSLSAGGFIENKGIEQAVIIPELQFFSYLYRIRRTNIRQFIRLKYVHGIRRFNDEFININNDNGVRGLQDTFLRGTKKISLKTETVVFTPLYLAGFRLAIFGFADLAVINSINDKLFKNTIYQGYGIGFRFRNENLAFNTFQIRLAWYPNTPPDFSNFGADFSGKSSLNILDFRVNEPEVLLFQ
jgi:hypothetical protein